MYRISTLWLWLVLLPLTIKAQSVGSVGVMSYNIRYNNPDDGVNRWANRKAKLNALLPAIVPEIIGFQEALFLQVRDLQAMLPDYDYVGVGRKDGGINGEMNPIFFDTKRFSAHFQGTFWLSTTPDQPGSVGWDAALPRIATWVILEDKINGQELLVVNTHLDHVGSEAREQSAVLLKEKILDIAQGRPFVLLGDFNSTPVQKPYALLTEKWLDTRTEALTIMGPEGTFTGFESPEPKQRTDYIIISPLLNVQSFSTISTNQANNYFSDHLPVKAILQLP